jgi:hypothetical protein
MFDLDVTHAHSPQPKRFRFEGLEIRLEEDQTIGGGPNWLARLADLFGRVRKPVADRRETKPRTATAGK